MTLDRRTHEIDRHRRSVALDGYGVSTAPANAAGCVKGAMVGGAAGHFMHHHGFLGAAAGCLIGRHEANKHAREQAQQNQTYNTTSNNR